DMRIRMAFHSHQLANDLRIGLAAKRMVVRTGAAEDFGERAMDRPLPGAVGEQDGSVDVEENELHDRVSKSPVMIEMAPTICHPFGTSPSNGHAIRSATTGWRFENMAVRVGPMTRTPRYQK